MEWNGQKLILDNYRVLLNGYSVDVQDVVRSAILDGVDISKYISQCKENSLRLDQIRLGMKEGLPEHFYSISSGRILYKLRGLANNGRDLSKISEYVNLNALSVEHLDFLLGWVEDGISTSDLNIETIPKDLLPVFDYGLRMGISMKVFNNGVNYKPEYLRALLQIKSNGKPVTLYLSGEWDYSVIDVLCSFSNTSKNKWLKVVCSIDENTTLERLKLLIKCVRANVPIKELVQRDEDGEWVYRDDRCIVLVYNACRNNLDYKVLLGYTNAEDMQVAYNEMELRSKKRVNVRLLPT